MRRTFADTMYWIALASPHDQWHSMAIQAGRALRGTLIVTTEEVLSEFLAHFCAWGDDSTGIGPLRRGHPDRPRHPRPAAVASDLRRRIGLVQGPPRQGIQPGQLHLDGNDAAGGDDGSPDARLAFHTGGIHYPALKGRPRPSSISRGNRPISLLGRRRERMMLETWSSSPPSEPSTHHEHRQNRSEG